MVDLNQFTQPKSDQLNADDLIGRTLTIKITKVTGQAGDQPVSIFFEGDNGKPYKPCKSMIRVLKHVWSNNAADFAGRYLTLYRDEKVKFGGLAVGGIRISHMSHMNAAMTFALTESKAKRAAYTVKPLAIPNEDPETVALRQQGHEAASKGVTAYTGWLGTLQPAQKEKVRQFHASFTQTAKQADAASQATQPAPSPAPVASTEPPAPEPSDQVEKQEPAQPSSTPPGPAPSTTAQAGFPGCGFCHGSGVELVKDINGEREEPCLSCFPPAPAAETQVEGTAL